LGWAPSAQPVLDEACVDGEVGGVVGAWDVLPVEVGGPGWLALVADVGPVG